MTIKEIAQLAGVSSAAVSRYLNGGYVSEEKKEQIRKVIEETGYQPSAQARMLRTKKASLVGVVVPKINSESISVLVTLAGGVRVVKAQVEQAAVVFGDRVVDEDRLGGADMQVAVRLRRETGMHDIDLALGEVGIDNIRQEVGKFFVCHDYTPKLVSVTLL